MQRQAALALQIAPQLAATLPYASRQAPRLETESLFQINEQGHAAICKDKTERAWEFPSPTMNLKTNCTYLTRGSHREIPAIHSVLLSTFS
jgi:hypothetical protein